MRRPVTPKPIEPTPSRRKPRGLKKRESLEASVWQRLAGLEGERYAFAMHDLIVDSETDPHLKAKLIQIVAPYLWRKLPEIHEHSGLAGAPLATQTIVVHEYHPKELAPAQVVDVSPATQDTNDPDRPH